MRGGDYLFWLGASAEEAETGSREPDPSGSSPSGFDPARGLNGYLIEVGDDGRAVLRGNHPFKCGCPICLEYNAGSADAKHETLQWMRGAIERAFKDGEGRL